LYKKLWSIIASYEEIEKCLSKICALRSAPKKLLQKQIPIKKHGFG
jgi:hypothetical protein